MRVSATRLLLMAAGTVPVGVGVFAPLPAAASAGPLPATRPPASAIGIDACVDLSIVVIDLGCPEAQPPAPAPTAPATTPPPATAAPTVPPVTVPAVTVPAVTVPAITVPPVTPAPAPVATPAPASPVVDVTLVPPATAAPAAPAAPAATPVGEVPLADIAVDTPILTCDLWAALVAATVDCNLAVLAALAPQLAPPVAAAPLVAAAAAVVGDVTTGLIDVDAVADLDADVGPALDVTGEVCLDVALAAPTGPCPQPPAAPADDGASLIDADVCADVAIAAPLSGACRTAAAAATDEPVSLLAADLCATAAIAGLTPDVCATADVLNEDEIADVCADVDLDPADAGVCGSTVTIAPGGPTTTTPGGPGTTDPTAPTTTIAGGAGPSTTSPGDGDGSGVGSGGGPGTRPGVRAPDAGLGRLPMTGLALGGTLALAALLVATGTGARLVGRVPGRR